MSVDTRAILLGAPNQEEIAAALRLAYPGMQVATRDSSVDGMFIINFPDPAGVKPGQAKVRQMYVHVDYGGNDDADVFKGRSSRCSLGCFGSSVEIMDALARHFGGYVCENDSKDEWRLVEASQEQIAEFSPEDRLRIAIASVAGAKAGAAISEVIDDEEKLAGVIKAFADYAAETAAPGPRP